MHRPLTLTPDARLAAKASTQHGLFTYQDALDAGLSPSALDNRVDRGFYVRLDAGLYAVAGHAPSRMRELQSGLLLVGGEAALARDSAAEVHGLPRHRDPRVHVVVRDRSYHGTRQVAMHRSTWFDEEHVTLVDGLRTTSAAWTLVDLAGSLSYFQLKKVVMHAMRERLTDTTEVLGMLERAGRVRGAVNLREILGGMSPLTAGTSSSLETMFVEIATAAGIPPTVVNHPVVDAFGRQRYLDAAYLPEHVPVEIDGRYSHSLSADRRDDRDRERAILATGEWRPFVRFDRYDLVERPHRVIAKVERALDAARHLL